MLDIFHHLFSGFAVDGSVFGFAAFGMAQLVGIVIGHLITGYPLFVMATRLGYANPWFGFIPILNLVMLVQLADLEIWWVIVCLFCWFPIGYPGMKLAEKVGKPSWVGILLFVPCVNVICLYYMAFG
jgi:hypothetical protein